MSNPVYELEEGQRQMVLLALAKLAVERPGWDWTLGELAQVFNGREMFETFKTFNEDFTPTIPPRRPRSLALADPP